MNPNGIPSLGALTSTVNSAQSWPLLVAEVLASRPVSPLQQLFLQSAAPAAGSRPAPATPAPGQTATPAPVLVQLLLAGQTRWLLSEQPVTPGQQLTLQLTPQGLRALPPNAPAGASAATTAANTPAAPNSGQAAPPTGTPSQPSQTPNASVVTQTAARPIASTPSPETPARTGTDARQPSPATPAAANSRVTAERINQHIDQLLNRRLPTETAGSPLNQALRTAWQQARPVTQAVSALVQTLAKSPELADTLARHQINLPTDGNVIRRALQQSGVFAEHNLRRLVAEENPQVTTERSSLVPDLKLTLWTLLAAQKPGSPNDLVSQLIRLLGLPADTGRQLQRAGSGLRAQAESLLANLSRQQLQWLASQTDDPAGPARLQFEFPVKFDQHTLPLAITLERQPYYRQEDDSPRSRRARQEATGAEWSLSFSMQIPGAGNLDARLRAREEQLLCTLWFDNDATRAAAEDKLKRLHQQMTADGIPLAQLHCLSGRMPSAASATHHPMLDTHA